MERQKVTASEFLNGICGGDVSGFEVTERVHLDPSNSLQASGLRKIVNCKFSLLEFPHQNHNTVLFDTCEFESTEFIGRPHQIRQLRH